MLMCLYQGTPLLLFPFPSIVKKQNKTKQPLLISQMKRGEEKKGGGRDRRRAAREGGSHALPFPVSSQALMQLSHSLPRLTKNSKPQPIVQAARVFA